MEKTILKIPFLFFTIVILIFTIVGIVYFGNSFLILFENDEPSQSIGTPSDGKLINGKRLPSAGENFKTYSHLGSMFGRTSVNSTVRDVILETYKILNEQYPDKKFVYGETGRPEGGPFPPHKTHQNGLSVDFMVPVVDQNKNSFFLPTRFYNKWGYDLAFDNSGHLNDFEIDFEILSTHLYYLNKTSEANGLKIGRVIFDPELQVYLFRTKYGELIRHKIRFSEKRSWVRHDEHYHVDFEE